MVLYHNPDLDLGLGIVVCAEDQYTACQLAGCHVVPLV